jgi:16S rRNA (adenine1518-N6/adenine1519-N6)-dimethyltransferase
MSIRRRILGQHFLNSQRFAQKISEVAGAKGETVVEIGSGKGILTRQLAREASMVIAVEIDRRLAGFLRSLAIPDVRVINQDFLKIDLDAYDRLVVVGNIPYNITSAILEKLIADKRRLKKVVLCVQKEYGDKLMAHIGDADYGYVTLYVNYHFHVRKEFSVPARFFSPRPKVSSVVVTLMPKAAELDEVQEKDLFRFIAGVFRYRRKSVKNAVINYAEKLPQYLDDGILRRRPQHLSFDDFCRIYMGLVNES